MYDDILYPTDETEPSDRTLEYARDIATERDATVHVLYVIDDRAFLTLKEAMQDDVLAELRAEGQAVTDSVATAFEDAGVDVTTALARGDPATEILEYARHAGVDLVTMGTRGDSYSENMLGSTAQSVVARSPVPVLTVRITAD